MSYFVKHDHDEILVDDQKKMILKVEKNSQLFDNLLCKFYNDNQIIFECSISRRLFHYKITVKNSNSKYEIDFERKGLNYHLKFNQKKYKAVKRSIFKIFTNDPIYKLYIDNVQTGEVLLLQKIYAGNRSGLLYKIDIYKEDEFDIVQIISFIVEDEQWNRTY